MTICFQRFGTTTGLLADEDVLPQLQRWQEEGQRTALVTLVGVEGGAPRGPGAQMAVAEDGRYAGYLSGGCLEQAVALEAKAVIEAGQNRLVRSGKGSPYFDIKLPCGSGLDLYFDQALAPVQVGAMMAHRACRRLFALSTVLATGESVVEELAAEAPAAQSRRDGDVFKRIYVPNLRLLLLGTGPALVGMAPLAAAAGIELAIRSPDDATRSRLAGSGFRIFLDDGEVGYAMDRLDFASAAILFFHDHEQEPDLLARLLRSQCFYIGALGNHAVHRERLGVLAAQGFGADDLKRIRAPVGSIGGAKSKATLAIGALAELMAEAKALNLVS
jgi:xanthine dehydrogenase accessory factor